jgi:predicted carbohydrate-binding protein with CBM5 and CBM33 domain
MIKKEMKYELTQKEFEQLCELTATAEELVRKSANTNYDFFTQVPHQREGYKNFIFTVGQDIDKALNAFFKLKYLLQSFGKHNVISNTPTKGKTENE